jgi:hypothetical protein
LGSDPGLVLFELDKAALRKSATAPRPASPGFFDSGEPFCTSTKSESEFSRTKRISVMREADDPEVGEDADCEDEVSR